MRVREMELKCFEIVFCTVWLKKIVIRSAKTWMTQIRSIFADRFFASGNDSGFLCGSIFSMFCRSRDQLNFQTVYQGYKTCFKNDNADKFALNCVQERMFCN